MFLALFVTCFISATLWPMASEAVFLGLMSQHPDQVLSLLVVATLGNSLGSIAMFELSFRIEGWAERRSDKHQQTLARWQVRLNRIGTPLLAFAWVPIVGDLLPLAGGMLKMYRPFAYFWLFFGKACRYLVLTGLALGWQLLVR